MQHHLNVNQTSDADSHIDKDQSGIHSISIINLHKPEQPAFENSDIYIQPNKGGSKVFNYGNSKAQINGISIVNSNKFKILNNKK